MGLTLLVGRTGRTVDVVNGMKEMGGADELCHSSLSASFAPWRRALARRAYLSCALTPKGVVLSFFLSFFLSCAALALCALAQATSSPAPA